MTDALHSHLLWYLNRSTGVVLVAVLTLSTALGVLSASGRGPGGPGSRGRACTGTCR